MSPSSTTPSQWLFVASRAQPAAIHVFEFQTESGEIGPGRVAAEVESGFMAFHPRLPILYAATREKTKGSQCNGGVRAFTWNEQGLLEELGFVSTRDNGATHIAVAPNGSCVLVCHYGGAGTTAIALGEDGGLFERVSLIQHEGSSAHPTRQTRPHPHGIAIDQASRFALVSDLGNDHIEIFRITDNGEIHKHDRWSATPGSGPRHLAMHPNGRWIYNINELNSTIDALHYDGEVGRLERFQSVSTLPADFAGESFPAEITVHPNGRFLYGSNRGHNSVVAYQIDEHNGSLTAKQFTSTQGDHPRYVGLDATGTEFLATNMETNSMHSYSIDADTGCLTPQPFGQPIGQPMCAVFIAK